MKSELYKVYLSGKISQAKYQRLASESSLIGLSMAAGIAAIFALSPAGAALALSLCLPLLAWDESKQAKKESEKFIPVEDIERVEPGCVWLRGGRRISLLPEEFAALQELKEICNLEGWGDD